MISKRFLFTVFILFILFLAISHLAEAKLLPRFSTKNKGAKSVATSIIYVSPKLRSDRKALNVYFSNLSKARTIIYSLIYTTNGKEEGISGSIDPENGDAVNRELLFGTCSSGVCRYHSNITNMRLEVVTELLSGKKTVKRFRIRI